MRRFFVFVGAILTLSVAKVITQNIPTEGLGGYISPKDSCDGTHHDENCWRLEGVVYSVAALHSIDIESDFIVVLTLEESAFPQVTFTLSIETHISTNPDMWVREKVILKRGEQRIFSWKVEEMNGASPVLRILANSQLQQDVYLGIPLPVDEDLLLQTDKSEYFHGETVSYRAVLVERYQNTTSDAKKSSRVKGDLTKPYFGVQRWHFARLPMGAPYNGIQVGNFTYPKPPYRWDVDAGLEQISLFREIPGRLKKKSGDLVSFAMTLGRTEVISSDRKVKASLQLTSFEGHPLEGHCEIILRRNSDTDHSSWRPSWLNFELRTNVSLSVDDPVAEIELEMVKGLETSYTAYVFSVVDVEATCIHVLSGTKFTDTKQVRIYGALISSDWDYTPPLSPQLHLSVINSSKSLRGGDVLRVRVRSCAHFPHLNAILSSKWEIYSAHRFSFTPPEEGTGLDQIIEVTLPQNVTQGTVNLLVYGLNNRFQGELEHKFHREQFSYTDKAIYFQTISIGVSSEQYEMKVVDQFDDGLSTKVALRFEGLESNSTVSIIATKLSAQDLEERRDGLRPLTCSHLNSPYYKQLLKRSTEMQLPWMSKFGEVQLANTFTQYVPYSTNKQSIIFDVDKTNSTGLPFLVTKSFDWLTQFGSYVFSAAINNPQTGVSLIYSTETINIPPPPVLSVPPSIFLGETMDVVATLTNPSDAHIHGKVTLELLEGESTVTIVRSTEVKPRSSRILKLPVTPQKVGGLIVSLRSNISSDLTVTKLVKVNIAGVVHKLSRSFLVRSNEDLSNLTSSLETMEIELPTNCTQIRGVETVVYEGDIFGDILSFVDSGFLPISSPVAEFVLFRLRILLLLRSYYVAREDAVALEKVDRVLKQITYPEDSESYEPVSVALQAYVTLVDLQLSETPFRKTSAEQDLTHKLVKKGDDDGSFRHEGIYDIWPYRANDVTNTALSLRVLGKRTDIPKGVDFLKSAMSSGKPMTNFEVALVALLFSEINDSDASDLLLLLNSRSSSNSNGTFWVSTRTVNSTTFSASVAATSFALLTHVNMNKLEEAAPIAAWLVSQRDANGMYGTLYDTAAAVESLSAYALKLSLNGGTSPTLVKRKVECVAPRRNISNNLNGLNVSVTEVGGSMSIDICLFSSDLFRIHFVEVSLPSGFLLQTKDKSYPGWPDSENIYGSSEMVQREKSTYLFRFAAKSENECFTLRALRMWKVTSSSPETPLVGSVTAYDLRDPQNKSTSFFYLSLENEVPISNLSDSTNGSMSNVVSEHGNQSNTIDANTAQSYSMDSSQSFNNQSMFDRNGTELHLLSE